MCSAWSLTLLPAYTSSPQGQPSLPALAQHTYFYLEQKKPMEGAVKSWWHRACSSDGCTDVCGAPCSPPAGVRRLPCSSPSRRGPLDQRDPQKPAAYVPGNLECLRPYKVPHVPSFMAMHGSKSCSKSVPSICCPLRQSKRWSQTDILRPDWRSDSAASVGYIPVCRSCANSSPLLLP